MCYDSVIRVLMIIIVFDFRWFQYSRSGGLTYIYIRKDSHTLLHIGLTYQIHINNVLHVSENSMEGIYECLKYSPTCIKRSPFGVFFFGF
jgi:hypothetical protein